MEALRSGPGRAGEQTGKHFYAASSLSMPGGKSLDFPPFLHCSYNYFDNSLAVQVQNAETPPHAETRRSTRNASTRRHTVEPAPCPLPCVYVFMCLCVYVFMCLCVYVFMCLCVYVFMCLCVYMFMCFCVYVFLCLCVYVFMCLCVYVFMCLCSYVLMFLCATHQRRLKNTVMVLEWLPAASLCLPVAAPPLTGDRDKQTLHEALAWYPPHPPHPLPLPVPPSLSLLNPVTPPPTPPKGSRGTAPPCRGRA